nr:helix-turn-helix transcriptional regulator [Bacillus sp. UMB0893]
MIAELRSKGYEIGPGTLYPYLHNLEKVAFLLKKILKKMGGSASIIA